ncbi:MAG: DUF4347 domain-containing protein [Planctomycetia bacterium]|nr:DUF4347 domain-containing protein [Planctomycetia bacterium]
MLVDRAARRGQRPTGTVTFTAIGPSGSTTLGSAAVGPDGRATLVDVDSGLIGQPGVIVQAAYSGDAFFAAAVKNDGGANAAQAMADPPVNDNPQIPANAQNLTVVVVAGKNGVQRAEWRDSARAYYGADAYIITNVHSVADLGARLAQLPAGSISRLVIAAHGNDDGAQLGNTGVAATRFNSANLNANAEASQQIRNALAANNALVDLQACSCAMGQAGLNNLQNMANILRARVRGADNLIGSWNTGIDPANTNWITVNPQ